MRQERFTKKNDELPDNYNWNRDLLTKTFVALGKNKLGQLEDIEEELGIDIITLAKALKEGLWIDHYKNGDLYHMQMPLIHSDYDSRREKSPIRVYLTYQKNGEWHNVEFKDYGKTWALTKEELEENYETH